MFECVKSFPIYISTAAATANKTLEWEKFEEEFLLLLLPR
jgi:hypothetical protein